MNYFNFQISNISDEHTGNFYIIYTITFFTSHKGI